MDKKEGSPGKGVDKRSPGNSFIFEGFDDYERRQLALLFVYLILMLVVGLCLSSGFYFTHYFGEGQKLVIYTARSGCLGSTVYCMWSYSRHVVRGDFHSRFIVWYLFRPFVGGILGIFSYYLIYSGVIATTMSPPDKADPEFSKIFYCSIAFIAGFSVDEFVGKLRDVAKALFTGEREKMRKSQEGQAD